MDGASGGSELWSMAVCLLSVAVVFWVLTVGCMPKIAHCPAAPWLPAATESQVGRAQALRLVEAAKDLIINMQFVYWIVMTRNRVFAARNSDGPGKN